MCPGALIDEHATSLTSEALSESECRSNENTEHVSDRFKRSNMAETHSDMSQPVARVVIVLPSEVFSGKPVVPREAVNPESMK